jgi:toxin CptA
MAGQDGMPHAPLELRLHRSRRLALLVFASHTLAVAALALMPLPLWLRLIGLGGVAFSLWRTVQRFLLGGAAAVTGVNWDEAGVWTLEFGSGARQPAELLGDSYLSLHLVILNFRVGGRRRSLVLFPDAAAPDELRRLRVRLRTQGLARVGAGPGVSGSQRGGE